VTFKPGFAKISQGFYLGDGRVDGGLMGRNPANRLRLAVYPINYRVLYIPGGDRRISEPSTIRS